MSTSLIKKVLYTTQATGLLVSAVSIHQLCQKDLHPIEEMNAGISLRFGLALFLNASLAVVGVNIIKVGIKVIK